jgi:hypothetical protein
MRRAGSAFGVAAATSRIVATTLLLAVLVSPVLAPTAAQAQSDGPPASAVVMVSNTDGQRLNLRAGPASDQPIVARLAPGEILIVTGPGRTVGITLWVPVRTSTNQPGWVSAEFVVLLSPPPPAAATLAETAPTRASASSNSNSTERASLSQRSETKGGPVDVEAKLKFPEVKGREQEITVWVTRHGLPVPGAIVTLESSDGEDGERFRELDPTNDEGRTRRLFDVRHEKGTVEIQVEAVAPDGGEGRTIVSYFRR